jgi:hypothetical protein
MDTKATTAYEVARQQRHRAGLRRFGDSHLTREDLLDVCLGEAADALVYLRLEEHKLRETQSPLFELATEEHAGAIWKTTRLGIMIVATARALDEPLSSFRDRLDERWSFGAQHYGERFMARANLPAALEELADLQVFLRLEVDRRSRLGVRGVGLLGGLDTMTAAVAVSVIALEQWLTPAAGGA